MLNTVSWQEFITAILALTILYYLVILFLFFRKDINRKVKTPPAQPDRNDSTVRGDNLMGQVQADVKPSKQTSAAHDIVVAHEPTPADYAAERYDGLVSDRSVFDLLNEIKILAGVAHNKAARKGEVLVMLAEVLRHYSAISIEKKTLINEHIATELLQYGQIEVSVAEVSDAWPRS